MRHNSWTDFDLLFSNVSDYAINPCVSTCMLGCLGCFPYSFKSVNIIDPVLVSSCSFGSLFLFSSVLLLFLSFLSLVMIVLNQLI